MEIYQLKGASGRILDSLERVGIELLLVAPKPFMPNIDLAQYERLEDVLDRVDVIMSLRAQLERHKKPIFEDYDEYAKRYCITEELLEDRAVMIMHPGPVMTKYRYK